MRILALDLSLSSTGVAHPDGSAERLRPPASAKAGMQRLAWIRDEVWERTAVPHSMGEVDLVVIEGYSFGTTRQANNAHDAGELGGVIRLHLFEKQMPYIEVPPASLKKYATGKGNAKKELVLVEAVKRLGYAGSSNDEADALWLRAMALDAYGEPVVSMPQVNREATGAVVWPLLGEKACSG